MKKNISYTSICALLCTFLSISFLNIGCGKTKSSDEIVLRICNWEEYIDEGDWGEDEVIDLSDGTEILGENSLVKDFEQWYFDTYHQKVRVEYSTFGTNEELYNQLTIGDVYDLVCPSEYMIMKLIREDLVIPYSESFYDKSIKENYYANGLSPYIKNVYDSLNIEGKILSTYAAGYMWGTLGIVYNPEIVSKDKAEHWSLLTDKEFYKRVTMKDSVRDSYFVAICLEYFDEITSKDFLNNPNYQVNLSNILNRTDEEAVTAAQDILTSCKDNVYSFETDSGKSDMVTGKVVANQQWSGDAVYTMDQADEDGVKLCYVAPKEGTNLWFDGWVMLKNGMAQDKRKQQAAEAFVNFCSKPENAIRNMYYIGYTSVISGGDSDLIFEYMDWNYGVEEDEEDAVEYSVGYFFEADTPQANEEYMLLTSIDQLDRQLSAQYPQKSVVNRAVVMECFDEESNERINRMWTNVRCFDMGKIFKKTYK